MSRLRNYVFLIVVAGGVLALDQTVKAWVRNHFALGLGRTLLWEPIPVRLVHWYNTGGVFGLLQGYSTLWVVLALVITLLLLHAYPRMARNRLLRLALALQLGGALGNLTDRLLRGYVTDFISIGRFPVFNLADVAITLGIGLLLLDTLRWSEPPQQEAAPQPPEAPMSSEATASHAAGSAPAGPPLEET